MACTFNGFKAASFGLASSMSTVTKPIIISFVILLIP
jgi:hypothetical protein